MLFWYFGIFTLKPYKAPKMTHSTSTMASGKSYQKDARKNILGAL